ncbi:MAG: DUF357 domain-containing protein [Thermosphaera sp.]
MEKDFYHEKIKAYIFNLEQALNSLEKTVISDKRACELINLAKSYLSDSKYYLDKGDHFTSLACIGYAEGLLDSLRFMGLISIAWKPLTEIYKRKRVLVAGSFEFLHPGHLHLLRKAWEIGRVTVIVSRDINFEKFKKRRPILSENDRKEVLQAVKYVDSVVLGDEDDFLKPILESKPDVILLGPDQWITPDELKKRLRERGLENVEVYKLEERVGTWSSSQISSDLKKIICDQKEEDLDN